MFFSILFVIIASPCDMGRFHPEVAKSIDLIKTRLNISSIHCNFISTYTPILPILQQQERDYIRTLGAEIYFVKEGNLSLCFNVQSAQYSDSNNKEEVSQSLLLNLLYKQYLKRQSPAGYEPPQFLFDCSYVYNGRPHIRNVYRKKDSIAIALGTTPSDETYEDYNGFGYFGDPRYHIGYLNHDLGTTTLSIPYKHLSDFLEKEGPYYLSHKDGNTVLWHGAFYDDIGALIAEIWIDEDENIHKIRLGFFPILVTPFSLEEVKNILEIEEVNCDSFARIYKELEFYDFREFNHGIRVPLVSIRSDYVDIDDTEYTSEEIEKMKHIEESYRKGEIEKSTYYLMSAPFQRTKKWREITIQIEPETLSINQEIPENVFIPPEITTTRKELYSIDFSESSDKRDTIRTWYSKYYSLLFMGACLAITLFLMVFTKRYLGWNF